MTVEKKSALAADGSVVPESYAFNTRRLQPEYTRYGGVVSTYPKQLIYGDKVNVFPAGRTIQVPAPKHPTKGSNVKAGFSKEQLAFYASRRDREVTVAKANAEDPLARIEATFTARLHINKKKKADQERDAILNQDKEYLPEGYTSAPKQGLEPIGQTW
jgi:hypothetical protein